MWHTCLCREEPASVLGADDRDGGSKPTGAYESPEASVCEVT